MDVIPIESNQPARPVEPVAPIEAADPVGLVALDYAAPTGLREFRAPIAVRLLLLAGAVAVFVPFTWTVSPFDTTLEFWKIIVVRRSLQPELGLCAVGFALEMALPMLLMAWVPQGWARISTATAFLCLIAGLLAAAGAAYVAINAIYAMATNSQPRTDELLAFCLYALALLAGSVLTFRTWRRSRSLAHVTWLLLATSYLPMAGLCLWAFRAGSYPGPELGYWLTIANLIPSLFQTIIVAFADGISPPRRG